MAEHRRLRPGRFDDRPRPLVERKVEAGQDHRAVGQAGDRRKQFGGGGYRAGRTRRRSPGRAPVRAPASPFPCGSARCDARPGSSAARSRSTSGQCDVTISKKSSVTCHQPARLPDASSPSLAQSAPSVSISSISAARSRASQMASAADAGTVTSSSNSAATCAGRRLFHACTSGASASSRSSGAIGGATSISPASAWKARSSSSNSPSGRIAGRIVERAPSCPANTLRSSRAARRVGTKMVVSASVSGAPFQANSGTSAPLSTASANVGRNGASAGIDSTRG